MIVFISAAATERQMVAAASKSLPVGFLTIQALDSGKLQSDDEIDNLLANVGVAPCVIVVRVLGGESYFERGFARLRDFCRERNIRENLARAAGPGGPARGGKEWMTLQHNTLSVLSISEQ